MHLKDLRVGIAIHGNCMNTKTKNIEYFVGYCTKPSVLLFIDHTEESSGHYYEDWGNVQRILKPEKNLRSNLDGP